MDENSVNTLLSEEARPNCDDLNKHEQDCCDIDQTSEFVGGSDIMTQLFAFDLDLVLQLVFLNLDPKSLHLSKQVCREWYTFINNRIWKSKAVLKRLNHKLEHQWKVGSPSEKILVCSDRVFDIRSDNDLIITGLHSGIAEVFDRKSGNLRFTLNHDGEPYQPFQTVIQVSMSHLVIVTVSSSGTVKVWCRQSGSLVQELRHHIRRFAHSSAVWGVSVVEDTIVTCGEDHTVAILKYRNAGVELVHQLDDHHDTVSHVDFDGTWALTGTRREMILWDVAAGRNVRRIPSRRVHSLAMKYPIAATVGSSQMQHGEPGICIWNVELGTCIRSFAKDQPMEDVRIYGNRLATATFPDHHLRRHCQVLVWDLAQAADPSVEEKTLWKREFFTRQSAEVGLAMDKTCLIHSEVKGTTSAISVRNFWVCQDDQPSIWDKGNFLERAQFDALANSDEEESDSSEESFAVDGSDDNQWETESEDDD